MDDDNAKIFAVLENGSLTTLQIDGSLSQIMTIITEILIYFEDNNIIKIDDFINIMRESIFEFRKAEEK